MLGSTKEITVANSLYHLIQDIADEQIRDMWVCLPGKITKYDENTHLASVQPKIKRKFYRRTKLDSLPDISRVPVVHPRTSSALIKLPVTIGDIVLLVFADRSIENWVAGDGAERDTLDTRMHDISDAFAIPGGYPEVKSWMTKNPGALEIVVSPGTKITIGNGTEEVLQLASDAFSGLRALCEQMSQALANIQLIQHTDSQGVTTSVPLNVTNFATIKTSVDNIRTQVDSTITSLAKIKV